MCVAFCADITHPIPDLTGYITEGQIYVDRQLQNRQVMVEGVHPSFIVVLEFGERVSLFDLVSSC